MISTATERRFTTRQNMPLRYAVIIALAMLTAIISPSSPLSAGGAIFFLMRQSCFHAIIYPRSALYRH
jgi:hypothetical protein